MSSSEEGGFEPPWWFSRAAALFTAGSASVAGVSIWSDPADWAIAAVSDFVVGVILGLGESLGALVLLVNEQIIGSFGSAGSTVLGGIGTIGSAILSLFGIYDGIVQSIAGAAGPLSFLVVVLSWVVAALLGAALFRLGVRLIVVIT